MEGLKIVKAFIKTILITIGIIAALLLLGCLVLYFAQDRMIFFPRKYAPGISVIEKRYETLSYKTKRNGKQFAYYKGPKDKLPKKLWIFTCGNGSLAFGWDLIAKSAWEKENTYGFLLVDYPGYGKCQGKPSRIGIQENMEGAIESLAGLLKTDVGSVKSKCSFIGHSLGCAVALEAAAKWERGEVIAVSPFTSMKDMAARNIGGPLINLVRHQWDNRKSIDRISRFKEAGITIYHGMADRVIPLSMSADLAGASPEVVHLIKKKGLGHNDIVGKLSEELISRLSE